MGQDVECVAEVTANRKVTATVVQDKHSCQVTSYYRKPFGQSLTTYAIVWVVGRDVSSLSEPNLVGFAQNVRHIFPSSAHLLFYHSIQLR